MAQLFKNNAISTLASSVAVEDVSITVKQGEGSKFPSPGTSDYFLVTVESGGIEEIMKCTSRIGDVLNVDRAQEDSVPTTFPIGAVVEMRITAGTLKNINPASGSELADHLSRTNPHPQYLLRSKPNLTGAPTAPTPASTAIGDEIATARFVKTKNDDSILSHVTAENPHTQYARANSPAFYGTPTTSDPADGDNSARIANTAFVSRATTKAIVDHKNEINPHSQYVNRESPEFTGVPRAPTAIQGDHSTTIATTEFVNNADNRKVTYNAKLDEFTANDGPNEWPNAVETWADIGNGAGWPVSYGRVVTYKGSVLGTNRSRQLVYEGDGDRIWERRSVTSTEWGQFRELWGDWNAEQEDWISPVMTDGWVEFGPPKNPVGFYRDKFGVAHIQGGIKGGSVPGNAFVIKDGYRPEHEETRLAVSEGGVAVVIIYPNGNVRVESAASTGYVSLDGISFRTQGCISFSVPLLDSLEAVTNPSSNFFDFKRLNYDILEASPVWLRAEPNEPFMIGARRVRNLLAGSTEDMNNPSWQKLAAGTGTIPVVTNNFAIAPDSTLTAARVQFNRGGGTTASDYSSLSQTISGLSEVGASSTVWVKSNDSNTYQLSISTGSWGASSVVVGTDWVRAEATLNGAPLTSLEFSLRLRGDVGASTSADILFWHPQLESTAGMEVPGPSEYISVGVLPDPYHGLGVDGLKVMDYDLQGNPLPPLKGFMSRAGKVNELLHTENFSDVSWYKTNIGVSSVNFKVGPDGFTRIPFLPESVGDGVSAVGHILSQGLTLPANQKFNHTCWVHDGGRIVAVQARHFSGDLLGVKVNPSTQSYHSSALVGFTDPKFEVEPVGFGWTKVKLSATTNASGNVEFRAYTLLEDGMTSSYAGDSTKGIYYAFPDVSLDGKYSSYIRSGSEKGIRYGTQIIGKTSGYINTASFVISFDWVPTDTNQGLIYLFGSKVDDNNGSYIFHDGTKLIFRKRIGGVNTDVFIDLAYKYNTKYTISVRMDKGGTRIFLNGVEGTSTPNADAIQVAATYELGSDGSGGGQSHGYFRNFNIKDARCEPSLNPVPVQVETPTPSGTTDPAPSGTTDPAPSGTTDPAPSGTTDPAPSGTTDPAPSGTTDPAPSGTTDPAPSGTTDPAPTFRFANFAPDFPRLGACNIGAKNYDDASYQTVMSRLDIVFVGFYPGWKVNYSFTENGVTYKGMRAAVKSIKSRAAAIGNVCLVGNYTIVSETKYPDSGVTDANDDRGKKVNAMDWWLRNASGNTLNWSSTYYNQGIRTVNLMAYTPKDSNGDRYAEWCARRDNSQYFSPIPELDYWYFDNVFAIPREGTSSVPADWNRDKVNETNADTNSTYINALRDGYTRSIKTAKSLQPNLLVAGNCDHDMSMYKDLMHGAYYEGALGASYSKPWSTMLARYRAQIANSLAPKIVILGMRISSNTDYKAARFGLCTTLLDDGYAHVHVNYDSTPWFDEFDNAGKNRRYLGAAVDAPPTAAWQNGVWKRAYQGGTAFVNPTSSNQSIKLDRNYIRIKGNQDTAVNSGATHAAGSYITIPAGDGLILLNN